MSSTGIFILLKYWCSSSSRTHVVVRPVVGDFSLFQLGLVWSSVLFVAYCVVGASPRVVQASSVLFVLVMLSGPRCVLSRPLLIFSSSVSCLRISDALANLLSPLWRAHLGSVLDLRRSCPPRCSTCIGTRGSWYHADWAFDWQVRTLCAFLGSDLGAAFWSSGGDTVESLRNLC